MIKTEKHTKKLLMTERYTVNKITTKKISCLKVNRIYLLAYPVLLFRYRGIAYYVPPLCWSRLV